MGAKQDIVIGAATGYEWADIEAWATSLVASEFAGLGVVIVYDRDHRGDLVADNLESLGLHAVRMPLRGSVYNQRFEDIGYVLRKFVHSLRFAVVTDVRDVYFQADPTKWLGTHLERPFLAVSEAVRYVDEEWNRDNLQRSFPAQAERLRSKVIRNVGVLAGQADMVADLCLAISFTAESAGVPVADQSAYNLLLDMEPYRSAVQLVASEDGFACQAATLGDPGKVRALRPFLLEPEPVLAAEGVQTAGGKLYPIVHQYDRVPEWDRALRSRLRSAPVVDAREAVRNTRDNPPPQRERSASSRAGVSRVPGDADGATILNVAHSFGVPRGRSSMQLYSPVSEHSSLGDGSPAPRVSVVCPTYQRPAFLRKVVRHYCAQTFGGGTEMIIVDDSPEPVDFLDEELCREHRIRYYRMPNKRMTLGDKLNLMTQLARGEIIVEFDDDDYYAPKYIERMVEFLGDAALVTLSRWFVYDPANKVFCYWSTDILSPTHFMLSPWEPLQPISTRGWHPDSVHGNLWGYGFSFVWRKSTYPEVEIRGNPPDGLVCDYDFALRLQKAGFKTVCVPDTEGLVLHTLHPGSSVRMFPQYVLPEFLIEKFFPLYVEEEV
ncbi:glycosyltransferase family 2 protein [Nocardia sp. NBC_01730]|uniref:glycosyltransferase family 2 protein n=1 Tax=Nocardia sp. NBC_01730 TaxID=2975998 RepID=UPI002E1046F1|nr:glycosyltransferase family 2 protein [Nocardia sp. NBC_01730]